jgi:hypothetical protein
MPFTLTAGTKWTWSGVAKTTCALVSRRWVAADHLDVWSHFTQCGPNFVSDWPFLSAKGLKQTAYTPQKQKQNKTKQNNTNLFL